MINATNTGGSDFKPIDAGTYPARCYSMIHIGTVKENFMGEDKMMNKVRITWELPTEMKVFNADKGEQPMAISKEFTLSMHEKSNLRKFLEGWRGKGFTEEEAKSFDITKLLGIPCMLSVIHKTSKAGKLYAEISSISAPMKGITVAPQINKSFEWNYDNFDIFVFNELPTWLQDKMKQSEEYKRAVNPSEEEIVHQSETTQGIEDNLPF